MIERTEAQALRIFVEFLCRLLLVYAIMYFLFRSLNLLLNGCKSHRQKQLDGLMTEIYHHELAADHSSDLESKNKHNIKDASNFNVQSLFQDELLSKGDDRDRALGVMNGYNLDLVSVMRGIRRSDQMWRQQGAHRYLKQVDEMLMQKIKDGKTELDQKEKNKAVR